MNKSKDQSKDTDDIRIIGSKIRPEIFSEFILYYEELKEGIINNSVPESKMELVRLAAEGSIEAYRKIERLLEAGKFEREAKDFAAIALNFCRFSIENDFLDESSVMISSGLGGDGKRLRSFLALTSDQEITLDKLEYIKKCWSGVATSKDSILEEIEHHGFYISLMLLCSMDYAIGDIIDEGLAECDFLNSDYYLTNVEIPTDSRIRDWLDGKLDDEQDYPPFQSFS
jgi:hypothetical protein